jgi:hypothetical protein
MDRFTVEWMFWKVEMSCIGAANLNFRCICHIKLKQVILCARLQCWSNQSRRSLRYVSRCFSYTYPKDLGFIFSFVWLHVICMVISGFKNGNPILVSCYRLLARFRFAAPIHDISTFQNIHSTVNLSIHNYSSISTVNVHRE